MPARLTVAIVAALLSVVAVVHADPPPPVVHADPPPPVVRADPPPPVVRIEPPKPLMPDAIPAWLPSAIHESLSHDLSRVQGVNLQNADDARFVVRATVQAVNGELRVDLSLLDGGRTVGVVRATEPGERIFALQDALGEQTRALLERALRRRSDDVAPNPRDVGITLLAPIVMPTTIVRPAFLAPSPTSLDAARLQRGRTYELPTGSYGCGGWYGVPGWYGWPGACRWIW